MDLVPVRVRDCECPGTPHQEEGDIVFLRPMLGLEGGSTAELDLVMAQSEPEGVARAAVLLRRWRVTFVTHGAAGWNWLDERGKPVPFDAAVLLADYRLGKPVADAANDLYQEAIIGPLAEPTPSPARSPNGRTGRSTSAARQRRSGSPASSSPATSADTQPLTP